jgi:hypothetical protein
VTCDLDDKCKEGRGNEDGVGGYEVGDFRARDSDSEDASNPLGVEG